LRFAVLALVACGLELRIPIITRLAAFACANPACTVLGAQLPGLPPLNAALVLTVGRVGGGHASLTWDFR
jgi:hypothetical protein